MKRRTFLSTLISALGLAVFVPSLPKKPDWKVAVGRDWGGAHGVMLHINSDGNFQGIRRNNYQTLTCRLNGDGTMAVPSFTLPSTQRESET